MTPDREKLRQLAERASKGPWRWDRTTINARIRQVDGLHGIASCVICYGEGQSPDESEGAKNASFIAAANPAAVLSLLDEIERLRADLAEAREKAFDEAIESIYATAQPGDPMSLVCARHNHSEAINARAASVHSRLSGEGE